MKNNLSNSNIKEVFFKSGKYLLVYLVFISFMLFTIISGKNIAHPKFELITFVIIAVLGIICIMYYFLHDSSKDLFKVAFVIILLFGIVCSVIVPICDVSDEVEHLTRAEITSQGVLIPHWTGNDLGFERLYNHTDGEVSEECNMDCGYDAMKSIGFFASNRGDTVFETSQDTDKINSTNILWHSAFEQNPFWGYLPQALGIIIAKLLDLNVIWILWLSRICNLICYAGLISLAVKIAPKYKMPLLAVSCIPITIYQAASASIDSMIFGLGILTVAYFIRLCLAENNSVDIKEIIIFLVLCLFLGLCKLPYLAFIFLLLFIPENKFMNKKHILWVRIGSVLLIALIGLLWSRYLAPALMHSWRSRYNYINPERQLNFLINHPFQIFKFLQHIFTTDLSFLANGLFNFYNPKGEHYIDNYLFVTLAVQLFLAFQLFTYPCGEKFELKTKLGSLFVILTIYVGTCFIQLLTWAYVGQLNMDVSIRYFIPLLALLPIIFQFNMDFNLNEKFNNYSIVFIISFMAMLILSFAAKYY